MVVAIRVMLTSTVRSSTIMSVPDDIIGEVELRLVRSNLTYHAMVEL